MHSSYHHWRGNLMFLAAFSAAITVTYIIIFRKPAGLTPVSRAVPIAEEKDALDTATAKALPADPVPPAPIATKRPEPIGVLVLPPVTLGEKSSGARKNPLAETKRPAALNEVRPSLPLAPARAKLRAGDATAALGWLEFNSKTFGPADSQERLEAAVLEGRALLKLGKLAEARLKFEPLAFSNAATETGCDALMGNFLCQAETMTRCRESELEVVRCGAESWGMAVAAIESAKRIEAAAEGKTEKLEEARSLYQKALDTNRLDEKDESECLGRLVDLTNRIVLDPKTACTHPKAVFHKVEPGEVAEKIARKYKVNMGQLKFLNHLNDKLTVRYGQVLKILPGDVSFKVDRNRLLGTLYIDGVFIKRFPVGIGPGNATPVGTYTIEIKVVQPDWYYDGKRVPFGDPANILGTRWMGFSAKDNSGMGGGLGVHGTSFPDSVPGRESKGCVRMHNSDVEELYDLMPQGGKVEISE